MLASAYRNSKFEKPVANNLRDSSWPLIWWLNPDLAQAGTHTNASSVQHTTPLDFVCCLFYRLLEKVYLLGINVRFGISKNIVRDGFLIDTLILAKLTKVRLPNPPSQPRDMILNFQLVDYNGFHRNGRYTGIFGDQYRRLIPLCGSSK